MFPSILIISLLACSPSTRFSSADQTDSDRLSQNRLDAAVMIGEASYYGAEFHGRKTANGEVFDMYKKSAAHKTLPFNTILEVTNLDNQKSVIVRINDRGPFVKGRILDLSYAAAREINMIGSGVARVRIRILTPDDQ